MKKIAKFQIVMIMLVLSLLFGKSVYAKEKYAAILTLHAYGDALIESSGGIIGHAMLTIKNISSGDLDFVGYAIEPNETISVSIWPDSMGKGGVHINREMYACTKAGTETTAISVKITADDVKKISDKTPQESYYHDGIDDGKIKDNLWHNCTTYSTKMWNMVVPKKYRVSNGKAGIDAPKWLVKEIKKKSGYKVSKFSAKDNTKWTDVLYVTKKGKLVPYEVKLNFKTKTIYTGETFKLKSTAKSKKQSVKWTSSKTSVATVNENGEVTAKKGGKTIVTVFVEGVSASCKITVEETIVLNSSSLSLEEGDTKKITATLKKKFKSKKITWKSSDTSIAKVDSSGKVTAKKAGKCVVTATAPNGAEATCMIGVRKPGSLKLNKSKVTLKVGEKITLKATKKNISAKLTWKSSKKSVAEVSEKGVVTAKKKGTTVITVSANGHKAECKVTVKKATNKKNNIWDGTVGDSYGGGSGTKSDPYIISNGNELAYLAYMVNSGTTYKGKYFKMTKDIYLNDVSKHFSDDDPQAKIFDDYTLSERVNTRSWKNTWTQIGWYSSSVKSGQVKVSGSLFSGTFSGENHTIYGLWFEGTEVKEEKRDNCGLFGYIDGGTIKNLKVKDSLINGSDYAGSIVGYLINGSISGCSSNAGVSGGGYVGGIVGYARDSLIKDCSCVGTASYIYGNRRCVGGIVGFIWDTSVSGCTNSMYIWSPSRSDVGGIAGYMDGGSLSGCSHHGVMILDYAYSEDDEVGAILGHREDSSSVITGCTGDGTIYFPSKKKLFTAPAIGCTGKYKL